MQTIQVSPSVGSQNQRPNVIIPDSLRQQLIGIITEKINQCSQDVQSLVNDQINMINSDRPRRYNQGIDTDRWEINCFLTSRENYQLNRLLEAGERALTDLWFGICKRCHQPIPVERLIEVPNTNWCTDCKNKHNNGS